MAAQSQGKAEASGCLGAIGQTGRWQNQEWTAVGAGVINGVRNGVSTSRPSKVIGQVTAMKHTPSPHAQRFSPEMRRSGSEHGVRLNKSESVTACSRYSRRVPTYERKIRQREYRAISGEFVMVEYPLQTAFSTPRKELIDTINTGLSGSWE
ncbi:hypothetical protein BDW74DRAFT_9116 [Aspergillus multicolor]|uniref:uncharacterized protein n=1 Tax=Aspergillus multicolor TaxID=41759 RepID=UPI003CCD1DB7